MNGVYEVDPADAEGAGPAVEAAAESIERGLLVVLPTETVYGIACRPDDPGATARLFEAKRRPARLTLPVLVPDVTSAWRLSVPSAAAHALAEAFWPGPLTMILPRIGTASAWELGEHKATIGLRVPNHPLAHDLMLRAGPLAATSANLSGRPPLSDAAGLVWTFGDRVAVYLVLPPGGVPGGSPSTVVDLTGDELVVLREGAIEPDRLRDAVADPARKPTG
jgi:L-threonylcarbamoyladenylate synthase